MKIEILYSNKNKTDNIFDRLLEYLHFVARQYKIHSTLTAIITVQMNILLIQQIKQATMHF